MVTYQKILNCHIMQYYVIANVLFNKWCDVLLFTLNIFLKYYLKNEMIRYCFINISVIKYKLVFIKM